MSTLREAAAQALEWLDYCAGQRARTDTRETLAKAHEDCAKRLREALITATKLYAVVNGDGDAVGIYSSRVLAEQAMERLPRMCCWVEEAELDKLPDEPEPRGEPDYGAPSAQEKAERDYDEKRKLR